MGRRLWLLRCDCRRLRLDALFAVVIDGRGGGVGVAARASDFVCRKARTHDWETQIEKEKTESLEALTDQNQDKGLE